MTGFSWQFLTLRLVHAEHPAVSYSLGFPALALVPAEPLVSAQVIWDSLYPLSCLSNFGMATS